MKSQVLQAEMSVQERTKKVQEAFQRATPEVKSKILELVPSNKQLQGSSNAIGFCDWGQK